MTTPVKFADDIFGLRLQVGQAFIALAALEAEIRGDMRQSVLLETIEQQRTNINDCAPKPAF
jgi:hypothetical protein